MTFRIHYFYISGYLRGLNGRPGPAGIPGDKGEAGIDGQDGTSCPTEMCVLPPKPSVEYVTQAVSTTIPTSVTDESIARRSDETGSYTGLNVNKKVRNHSVFS